MHATKVIWCLQSLYEMYHKITNLLLIFIFVKNVFSLQCITSTWPHDTKKINNITYEAQDCSDYIKGIRKSLNAAEGEPEHSELMCFTVTATAPLKFPVYFKGCAPKSFCRALHPIVEEMFNQQRDIDCFECEGDFCNSSSSSNLAKFSILFLSIVLLISGS